MWWWTDVAAAQEHFEFAIDGSIQWPEVAVFLMLPTEPIDLPPPTDAQWDAYWRATERGRSRAAIDERREKLLTALQMTHRTAAQRVAYARALHDKARSAMFDAYLAHPDAEVQVPSAEGPTLAECDAFIAEYGTADPLYPHILALRAAVRADGNSDLYDPTAARTLLGELTRGDSPYADWARFTLGSALLTDRDPAGALALFDAMSTPLYAADARYQGAWSAYLAHRPDAPDRFAKVIVDGAPDYRPDAVRGFAFAVVDLSAANHATPLAYANGWFAAHPAPFEPDVMVALAHALRDDSRAEDAAAVDAYVVTKWPRLETPGR